VSEEETLENIISFMEQRTEFILSSSGYEQDLIKSVISLSSFQPLKLITLRLNALQELRKEELFQNFLLAIKRVKNITPKTPLPPVNTDLFMQEEEKNLYTSFVALRNQCMPLLDSENFSDGIRVFTQITPPINTFFDKVMVMDKQEEIKTNRLALLKGIWETLSLIADFSKIQ